MGVGVIMRVGVRERVSDGECGRVRVRVMMRDTLSVRGSVSVRHR